MVATSINAESMDAIYDHLFVNDVTVYGTMAIVTGVDFTGATRIGDTAADTLVVNASWPAFSQNAIPFFASDKTLIQDLSSFSYDPSTKTLNVARVTLSPPATAAGSGSEFNGGIYSPPATVTFSSPQTGNVFGVHVTQVTIGQPSATTIPVAATVKVDGPPIAGANATITNAYSVWVLGSTRIDTQLLVNATSDLTGSVISILPATSIVGSASLVHPGIRIQPGTTTFTGGVAQSGDVNVSFVGISTLTSATAGTITNASSFKIAGAPTIGGSITITNAYALWVAAGLTKLDGGLSTTTINGLTVTASTGTLTVGAAKTLSVSNTLTFTGTDGSSVAFGGGGTVAFTSNKLSVFAATSSAELASILSDETGSGSLVFATNPVLVTPTLGAATATSINGVTIPVAADTVALLGTAQTFTRGQAISPLTLTGLTLNPPTTPIGSASVFMGSLKLASGTTAFATNPQTGDYSTVYLDQTTLTNPSAGTITNAATLQISGAPIAGSGVTLTNSYALLVTGQSQFNSNLLASLRFGVGVNPGSSDARIVNSGAQTLSGSATARISHNDNRAATFAFTGGTAQTGEVTGTFYGIVTLTNATAGTVTNASTVKINGAPIAGSGMTITNPRSLWVAGGLTQLDGGLTTGTVIINPPTAPTGGASALTGEMNKAAGTIAFVTNPQTGDYYSSLFDQTTLTNPSAGTITNAATVRIVGAPIASTNVVITNAYALWVVGGNSFFGSNVNANVRFGIGTMPASTDARFVNIGLSAIAGSSSARIGYMENRAVTLGFTGGTAQTGDVSGTFLDQMTLTNATSGTVPNATTLRIVGAPIAGSGMTITNSRSIWVVAGLTQLDGGLTTTTVNGLTVTTSSGTLTIANGKTHVVSNSITLTGTDGTSFAFPGTSDTVGCLAATQTWTGPQTFSNLVVTNPLTSKAGSGSLTALGYVTVGGVTNFTTAQTGNIYTVGVGAQTITGTASQTIPIASSLFVSGAPIASTNTTITTSLSLYVAGGLTRLDGGLTVSGAAFTLTDQNMVFGTTTGTQHGTATNQKQSWWGATPVVQRSGASQAAVVTTGAALASYGYTQAQANGIITLLNEIQATLVQYGLFKGSA